jgi:hypothetical protein
VIRILEDLINYVTLRPQLYLGASSCGKFFISDCVDNHPTTWAAHLSRFHQVLRGVMKRTVIFINRPAHLAQNT